MTLGVLAEEGTRSCEDGSAAFGRRFLLSAVRLWPMRQPKRAVHVLQWTLYEHEGFDIANCDVNKGLLEHRYPDRIGSSEEISCTGGRLAK